jgi:hypothetical protein
LVSAIVGAIPLELGIALNPIAIVAGILILRTGNARRNGMAFVVGWILGLVLLVVLPALLVQDLVGVLRDSSYELPAIIWLGLGALLLVAAAYSLRHRTLPGEQPAPPRWAGFLDRGGVFPPLGLGGFLATVSLRNLALLAAAVSVIGQATLSLPELAVTVAMFVAISSLGILIPLLVRMFGGEGADARLEQWSAWLTRHMGTMTAVVLALVGIYLLSRGIARVL